jgi:Ser/Thr protein kinase RdoA (MazF antagonist)
VDTPPAEVMELAGIDPADLRRLEWAFPIWTWDAAGDRIVIGSKRGRTDESLDWEAALLDGLERSGFPASRAARIFGGKDYAVSDGLHYSARSWVPGRMLVELDQPDLFAVGRFIGEYHTVAATIHLPQRPGIAPLADTLSAPDDDAMLALVGDAGLVRRFRRHVHDVLPSLDADVRLPVHGDFTTRNIAAEGPSTFTGLIDFGMAHAASPAVELAYALGSARTSWTNVDYRLDEVTNLFRGYCTVRSLESADARRIVDYARSRPLLGLAVYAIQKWEPRPPERSLRHVEWLTEHRDEMIATIEAASSSAA